MAASEVSEFPSGFLQYLDSGQFSDMTIICGGSRFAVHKVVVFAQSEALKNKASCSSGFKEFETYTVNLMDDKLCLVKRMIRYFYSGSYLDAYDESNTHLSRLTLAIYMHSLADKYEVPGLVKQTIADFQTVLAKSSRPTDCMMYVPDIYESTPYSSAGLRDRIVDFVVESYMSDNTEKKWDTPLKTAFNGVEEFGWDCFVRLQKGPKDGRNWKNPKLQSEQGMKEARIWMELGTRKGRNDGAGQIAERLPLNKRVHHGAL